MTTELPVMLTVERLLDEYDWLKVDYLYDVLGSGELVGFKVGRRWLITPADWADFLARRRGVATDNGSDAPPTVAPSRRRRFVLDELLRAMDQTGGPR